MTAQHRVRVTFFPTMAARFKSEAELSLEEIRDLILNTKAAAKDKLPWLKLAKFGENRSSNDCLRHNANVLSVSGVEMDYDAKEAPIAKAVEILTAKKIAAVVYSSPTHKPDAPKWRVLCPSSADLAPAMRAAMAARINGIFGGIFSRESFTLSQAYYYGRVGDNSHHSATVVSGDFVDLRADLDATQILKDAKETRRRDRPVEEKADPVLVRMAMGVIPPEDDWVAWNATGMAIWVATEGSDAGLEMFDAWSAKSTNYNKDAASKRWSSYFRSPPNQIGMGSLIYRANGSNPHWRAKYDRWRRECERLAEETMDQVNAAASSGLRIAPPAMPPPPDPETWRLETVAEVMHRLDPEHNPKPAAVHPPPFPSKEELTKLLGDAVKIKGYVSKRDLR